jgi:hypothetical protein
MNKEGIFWNWFKKNNSKYYYLNLIKDLVEKEKLLDEFLKQLHNYCDKLYFEIGGFPNQPQELIISAEGNKNYFDKVEALVKAAPKINDWQIIAFKPPMGVDFTTEYGGVKLNVHEIWFLPLENGDDPQALGLRIYLPNYNAEQENVFIEGCYQVLDGILGEKTVTLDIQHVEVDKLPIKPEEKGLIELSELQKYISWRKQRLQ